MYDLTKNIKLDSQLQKKYLIARSVLHFFFLIAVILVADKILFPSVTEDFFFDNINSLKNTLTPPVTNASSDAPTPIKGIIGANQSFSFNSNPYGDFSNISVSFASDTKSTENTQVTIRKSYQAFLYPAGSPAGFRNGSLLTLNGNYYIVSDGLIRKFASAQEISELGYSESAFKKAQASDLTLNPQGSDIFGSASYPDDTLFKIDNTYYQLKNQQLLAFVSGRAFASQFEENQAINKTADLFNTYPKSETAIGFANGTLASSDVSVFILSNGKSYPVINAPTFESMGYDWNSVIAMDSEELGLYERQKQFTDSQPHPDGTLFLDQKTKQYYVIEAGKRRPITSKLVLESYAKQKPIFANSDSFTKQVSCNLKKQMFSNTYTCSAPLDSIYQLPGNSYQIQTTFTNETKLKELHVTFSTPLSWQNSRNSLATIKNRIRDNYLLQ